MEYVASMSPSRWGIASLSNILICLAVFSTSAVSVQAQTSVDSEEVHRLNQKIGAQADQLAAQQAQINALQAAFAQQKALLEKLLQQSSGTTSAIQPAPVSPPPTATAPESTLRSAVVAPLPAETVSSSIALKQEQKEQPYVKQPKRWYDKYTLRGYVQIRDNGLVNTEDAYKCDQCDKSIGPNNNLFLRRARLVLSGNVTDRISVYIQPDFASASGTSQNFAQLRDGYFDVTLDAKKESRIRAGQSKIPYGFEAMQSSSNRLDLDRSDAINSSFANERDLGVFYYWAPANIRARFNEIVARGLKGTSDFGVFGTGFFNGQILNTPEANKDFHYVARYTYPFELRNGQFIEASIQGYTGKYNVTTLSPKTTGRPDFRYDDRRIAGSLIIYPQPLGLQIEYNWGTGPEYNPQSSNIDQKGLNGGYALLNYMQRFHNNVIFTPYLRFQYYNGGKKQELDARRYLIREGDLGIEAQFGKYIELTPQYQYGDRTFEDAAKPSNRYKGSLLRLQLQFNY